MYVGVVHDALTAGDRGIIVVVMTLEHIIVCQLEHSNRGGGGGGGSQPQRQAEVKGGLPAS